MIDGHVAPGFESVREVFGANFAEGLEHGAAFSAWRGGDCLVDLWGGEAGAGQPWQRDTLVMIFSGSKAITAICMWLLIDRGVIDLEAPVSRHWRAFGKPEVLVRHVLTHSDGLPGLNEPTSWDDLLAPRVMAARLERQARFSDPCAQFTYHPQTFGYLCGELLRQADGRTIGQFLAEEIARPRSLDIWLGLPETEEPRVATTSGNDAWGTASRNTIIPTHAQKATDPVRAAIWYNPPMFGPSFGHWNSGACHAAEMPAVNCIATARDVAKLLAIMATGGGDLVRTETVLLCTSELKAGIDLINDEPRRYGAGVSLQTASRSLGPPRDAFGHLGAGGSVHGAWPSLGVGFSYAMNRLIEGDDPRARLLLGALHDAIA